MAQKAAGLQHIHLQNWVHRDIKPENILISKTNVVQLLKISDYGLSKKTEVGFFSLSSDGFETLEYVGPELLRFYQGNVTGLGINLANASDIFSMGYLFYQLFDEKTSVWGQQGYPFKYYQWKF